ncbi:MAG: sensor histidine kinase [Anaerolineae bacterium]|nr:sensor histidine kinase [Anaerolineae bacterium]
MTMLDRTAEDLLRILNADQPQQQIGAYLVMQIGQRLKPAAIAYYRLDPELARLVLDASIGLPEAVVGAPVSWEPRAFLEAFGPEQSGVQRLDLTDPALGGVIGGAPGGDGLRGWLGLLRDTYAALLIVPLLIGDDAGAARSAGGPASTDELERCRGVLTLLYTAPPADWETLTTRAARIAAQAALVVENAWLRRQAEQAAVLQERSRLARDLHDSVTQSLYSVTLLAEATRRLANSGDLDQARVVATRLGEIGQQALKEMRLLVYQLRPSVLRRVGLVRALSQRLETVERRAGVEASLTVDGDLALPATLEEQLYYLAQEALNNALKHAAATSVNVRIVVAGSSLRLEIVDDGKGFSVDRVTAEGSFGLSSMEERAERLGGELVIDSTPGSGTRVIVTLDQPVMDHEER